MVVLVSRFSAEKIKTTPRISCSPETSIDEHFHFTNQSDNVCGQWPIGTLDFVNITSARKPLATVVHLLGSKISAVTSTHAVLILQIYVGAIENRVPPMFLQV